MNKLNCGTQSTQWWKIGHEWLAIGIDTRIAHT
jgi:hypothetical protein